jgi:hypothetical protein
MFHTEILIYTKSEYALTSLDTVLIVTIEWSRPHGIHRSTREGNIKVDHKETGRDFVNSIQLLQDRNQGRNFMGMIMNSSGSLRCGNFVTEGVYVFQGQLCSLG